MGKKKSKKDETGDPYFDPSEWEEVLSTEAPSHTAQEGANVHQPITLSVDALLRELRERDRETSDRETCDQRIGDTTDRQKKDNAKPGYNEKPPFTEEDGMAMKAALPFTIDLSSVDIYNMSDVQSLLQKYKQQYRHTEASDTTHNMETGGDTIVASINETAQPSDTIAAMVDETDDASGGSSETLSTSQPDVAGTACAAAVDTEAVPNAAGTCINSSPSAFAAVRALLWAEDLSEMSAEEYFMRMRVEAALAEETLVRGAHVRAGGSAERKSTVEAVNVRYGLHETSHDGNADGVATGVGARKRVRENECEGGSAQEADEADEEAALAVVGALLHARGYGRTTYVSSVEDEVDERQGEQDEEEDHTESEDVELGAVGRVSTGHAEGADAMADALATPIDEEEEDDDTPLPMYGFPAGAPHAPPATMSVSELAASFDSATDTSRRTVPLPLQVPLVGVAVDAEQDASSIATQAEALHRAYTQQRAELYAAGERLLQRQPPTAALPQLGQLMHLAQLQQPLFEVQQEARARVAAAQPSADSAVSIASSADADADVCPASVRAQFPPLFSVGVAATTEACEHGREREQGATAPPSDFLSLVSPTAVTAAIIDHLSAPTLLAQLTRHYSQRAPSVAEILSGAGPSAPQVPPFELLQCARVVEACVRAWSTPYRPASDAPDTPISVGAEVLDAQAWYPFRAERTEEYIEHSPMVQDVAESASSLYNRLREHFPVARVPDFYHDGRLSAQAEAASKAAREARKQAEAEAEAAAAAEVEAEVALTEAESVVASSDDAATTLSTEMDAHAFVDEGAAAEADIMVEVESGAAGAEAVMRDAAATEQATTAAGAPSADAITTHTHQPHVSVSSSGLLMLPTTHADTYSDTHATGAASSAPEASLLPPTTTILDLVLGSLPCVSFLEFNHPRAPLTAREMLSGDFTALLHPQDGAQLPYRLPTLCPRLSALLQLDHTAALRLLTLLSEELHDKLQVYTRALQGLPKRNRNDHTLLAPTLSDACIAENTSSAAAESATPTFQSSFSSLPALPSALFRLDAQLRDSDSDGNATVGLQNCMPLLTACATSLTDVHICTQPQQLVDLDSLASPSPTLTDVLRVHSAGMSQERTAASTGASTTTPQASATPTRAQVLMSSFPSLTLCQNMRLHMVPVLSPQLFAWLYSLLLCCETPLNADASATVNVLFRCLALLRWLADARAHEGTACKTAGIPVTVEGIVDAAEDQAHEQTSAADASVDATSAELSDTQSFYAPYQFYSVSAQEREYISSLRYLMCEVTRNQCHVLMQLIRTRTKQGYSLSINAHMCLEGPK